MTDATALARVLFGTDDTELMTIQQLLDYKVIQLALAQAQREGRQQGIRLVGEDLQHGLPDVWKKSVLLRCEHLAELQAQVVKE